MNQALADYALALRRRWRWVAIGALLALVGAVLTLLVVRPMYVSHATVFVRTPGDVSKSIDGGDTYARHRAASYVDLARSRDLAAEVADTLGMQTDPEVLANRISAHNEPDSVLIDVEVRAANSDEAQRTAAAFLTVFAKRVNALESVHGSVAPRAELVVIDSPDRPLHRSAWGVPIPLILLAAVLAGTVLGALAAVLRSVFDRTVRDTRDVERITKCRVIEVPPGDDCLQLTARAVIRALEPADEGMLLVTAAAPHEDGSDLARMLTSALRTLTGSASLLASGDIVADQGNAEHALAGRRDSSRWVIVGCPPMLTSIDADRMAGDAIATILLVTLDGIDENTLRRAGELLPTGARSLVVATRSARPTAPASASRDATEEGVEVQ